MSEELRIPEYGEEGSEYYGRARRPRYQFTTEELQGRTPSEKIAEIKAHEPEPVFEELRLPTLRKGEEPKFLSILDSGKESVPGILACEPDVNLVDETRGVLYGSCQTQERFPDGHKEPFPLGQTAILERDTMQCIKRAKSPQTLKDEITNVLSCNDRHGNPCLTGSQTAAIMHKDRDNIERIIEGNMIRAGEVFKQDPQSEASALSEIGGSSEALEKRIAEKKRELWDINYARWWFGEARYCLRQEHIIGEKR